MGEQVTTSVEPSWGGGVLRCHWGIGVRGCSAQPEVHGASSDLIGGWLQFFSTWLIRNYKIPKLKADVWFCWNETGLFLPWMSYEASKLGFDVVFTRTWLRFIQVYAITNPYVVCNVGAPYSGRWTFRQNFFTNPHCAPSPSSDLCAKSYGDHPRGTLHLGH